MHGIRASYIVETFQCLSTAAHVVTDLFDSLMRMVFIHYCMNLGNFVTTRISAIIAIDFDGKISLYCVFGFFVMSKTGVRCNCVANVYE